jgi:hypothetical protein
MDMGMEKDYLRIKKSKYFAMEAEIAQLMESLSHERNENVALLESNMLLRAKLSVSEDATMQRQALNSNEQKICAATA